jgi:glycosyltransferase involved in cell wall biosynthesis
VADIIQALKYLPAHVKLLVLGTGSLEHDLKQIAADMHLSDRVSFLGYVSHAEMPKYLQVSDIFIRPSLTEGFGNSFIEAMATGIPVIATPVGGIVDFLKDGETGLFCEVNNPQSIAQKVEKLIKDSESRNYIIERARAMVKEKYQWSRIAGEMKKVLLA